MFRSLHPFGAFLTHFTPGTFNFHMRVLQTTKKHGGQTTDTFRRVLEIGFWEPLHPRIINMEPQNEENWKMIVLFQGGSFRFLVGFPGVYYLNPATSPSHVYFLLCFPPQSRDGQKWQNAMRQKLQLGRLQWDIVHVKIINWPCWVAEKIYNILWCWCIVLKSIFWDTSRKRSTATHFQVLVRVRNDSN